MRFGGQSKSRDRPFSARPAEISGAESQSQLSLILDSCSLLVVVATVCILPWLLGGAIPKARLVLQVGSIAAAVLTMLARLVSRRSFAVPPLGSWLLLGMAAIGIVQLQPWMPSAISLMNHAVHPEFREHLPHSLSASAHSPVTTRIPADSRSAAPAMTRLHIAQWIAVAVLLCVVADSLSRPDQLMWMLGLMCANASLLTILSLQQLFNTGSRGLSEPWIISKTLPFGSFVNPNNASGWLLVHMAIAIGMVVVVWGKNPSTGWSRSFHRPSWKDQLSEAAAIMRHRIASLNNIQIVSVLTVVLLLTGVAATLSRAGIVAGVCCLVVCAASRLQWRKSLLLLVPFSILLISVSIFLTAFELDTLVLAELRTLNDPVSESTSRLLHWSDSLRSLRDFPLLGSGQGAYAWSTLPYQRRGGSHWFMNADNQYVEILVESGLLGFVLFAGFGMLLTVLSVQLILRKSPSYSDHGLWSHRIAVGMACMAMVASQGIVAFFDFGIGLSSTLAAIAVFAGVLTAVSRSRPANLNSLPPWLARGGESIGWVLRLALVAAACASVAELRQVDQIYPAIVESSRLLNSPVTRAGLERLSVLDGQLTAALKRCPDNPTVRDLQVNVQEARMRLRLIDALAPQGSSLDGTLLQSAWTQLTPVGMADRVVMLKKNLDPASFNGIQSLVSTLSIEFPWYKIARDASRQIPLAPGFAVDAAAGSICIGKLDDAQLRELIAVRFAHPAGARWLYQCGILCLIGDRPQHAVGFWNQSLDVSESFRINILVDALRFWTPDQALALFAPLEYAATIRAALSMSSPELEEGLWKIAESQWLTAARNPTTDQRIQRANYLLRRESSEAALEWIDGCLAKFPELLALRQTRAETLEKLGKLDEAIGEWLRYEHYDSKSKLPAESMTRLINSKNK